LERQEETRGNVRKLAVAGFVVVLIAVFLAGGLHNIKNAGNSPDNVVRTDPYSQYLPFLTFEKECVLAGSLPLWSPYVAVGWPLFARGVSLYPVTWVIFLLDVPFGMLVIQFLDVAIGMAGMFFYMRYLRLEWPAVILSTVLFGYAVLSRTFSPTVGSTYAWLPIIVLMAHRLADKPGFRASVALSLTLSLCYLAGFFPFFYYTCFIVAIYFFCISIEYARRHSEVRPFLWRLGLFTLAFVLTLGLISAQLLPTLELSMSSISSVTGKLTGPRSNPSGYDFSLIRILDDYLDRGKVQYLGSSMLLLPFALGSKKSRVAAVALLAALGYAVLFLAAKHIPALAVFGRLPFSDAFRWHSRIIYLFDFMIAALAGIGLSSLCQRDAFKVRDSLTGKLSWYSMFGLACVIGLSLAVLAYRRELLLNAPTYPLILLSCFVLGLISVSYLSRQPLWPKRLSMWAIGGLILLDVASAGKYEQVAVPATTRDITTKYFHDERIRWAQQYAGYDRVCLPPGKWIDRLHVNAGNMFGIFCVNSYEGFTLDRWSNFVLFSIRPELREKFRCGQVMFYGLMDSFVQQFLQQAQAAGLTSLRYFLSYSASEVPPLADAWRISYESDTNPKFYVYENECALPRAYLVSNYIITQNEEESLYVIRDNIPNLRHSVVLEGGIPSFPSGMETENPGQVRITKYHINEVELHVEAEMRSLLILTDSYYPGWNAFVDGVKKPVWRANSLFRAVEVTAGEHLVEFKYQPASFYWGISISAFTLLVILVGLFLQRVRAGRLSARDVEPV